MADLRITAGFSASAPQAQPSESATKGSAKATAYKSLTDNQVDQVAKDADVRLEQSRKLAEQVADNSEQQEEQVQEAVSKLNDYIQNQQRNLRFSVDDDSGETVVTVLDGRSEEVIRQIPDETVLRLARKLDQDEPLQLFSLSV
ncbi:flagellar protein FlaG [Litoribrevibacter albus]|uniref:Flagellar protein FlaG n=1 Tax=Litoribrevibacter albus TaxID=1473156 RepID=A0AA37SBL4_9GAMM|nr:flagellar protein FlaG [Litoribrevibacter albus]GLQ32229.1 flagellar protein FlaG [Litoribrevibacter albus]